MAIVVRQPNSADRPEWSRMRTALWPKTSAESHAEEIAASYRATSPAGWRA